jgi:type II secretory pathway component GspD/PulD (secretin)
MFYNLKFYVIVFFLSAVFLVVGHTKSSAYTVNYSNDRLSVKAENEPLVPVLEQIAKQANIIIFISRDFMPGNINVHVDKEPLEKALEKILKGLNVAKVYHKKSGKAYLTAVKIYPKGKYSGPLDVIVKDSIPEQETHFSSTKYPSFLNDTLQPQDYVRTVEYDSMVTSALEFEKREEEFWEKIQSLKNEINEEVDESKNQVLSLALLDKYEEFEQMQQNHINTLEKMYRMEHFNKSRAKDN